MIKTYRVSGASEGGINEQLIFLNTFLHRCFQPNQQVDLCSQTDAGTAKEQAKMLVGQKGRTASLLLGSLRLPKLLVKLHLWHFFSKESNMQVAGWIAAFGLIQTCGVGVFPNTAEHIVLDLVLPYLMLSQHAAAKDKQGFEMGQAS